MRAPALIRSTHLFAFLLALFGSPASHAIVIEYEALDLVNTTPGADLWQYNYYVSDYDFLTDKGFTIWFGLGLYDHLAPVSASPGWNTLAAQPDPLLPDAGFYDALAQVDHASLTDLFNVQFNWLGTGAPGSQAFDLYDLAGGSFTVLDTGNTVLRGATAIPEPASLWLMFAGGVAAWWMRRRDRHLSLA